MIYHVLQLVAEGIKCDSLPGGHAMLARDFSPWFVVASFVYSARRADELLAHRMT